MRVEVYRVFLVEGEDIPAVRLQGAIEVAWATDVEEMCTLGHVEAVVFNNAVMTWPPTLLQRLEWGDLPHYGGLGGVSHWHMEALMDQVVHSSGGTI